MIMGASCIEGLTCKTQAGQLVHLLDVRAFARQGVLAPGAVTEALEYPPFLHGLVEREGRPSGRLIGVRGDTHRGVHTHPQLPYPTSVPFERAVRRDARGGAVEGPAGFEHGVTRGGQPEVRAIADRPLPCQGSARGLFLAPSQVEHDPGAEAEGPHRQIACSASTASPKPTRASAG